MSHFISMLPLNIMPARPSYTVVLGMGKTGLACVNFLVKKQVPVRVMDNRPAPPGLATLQRTLPQIPYTIGHFDAAQLAQATEIIISPGLSRQEPALALALARSVPIISEIELFARYQNAPVVAITGSNGKSSVTTLLGEMAKQAGWRVQVGGNLGTPALELLCTPAPDIYILELSSFQLESTYSLNPLAAVVLNISQDHQDRYADISEYITAKQRIFQGDGVVVINADEPSVVAMLPPHRKYLSFSLYDNRGDFRYCQYRGELYLARAKKNSPNPFLLKEVTQAQIKKPFISFLSKKIKAFSFRAGKNVRPRKGEVDLLLPTKSMKLQGVMMRANALAALALGDVIGLPTQAMLEAVQAFRGLPHRCAWIANSLSIDWFNDSKGTNVGATIAAIESLEKPGQIILIAGGAAKGMPDFTPLAVVVARHCRACVLIGRDARLIANVLTNLVPVYYAPTLDDAVKQAAVLGNPFDAVLLSPACASFDMFKNYEHRGWVFEEAVKLVTTPIPHCLATGIR